MYAYCLLRPTKAITLHKLQFIIFNYSYCKFFYFRFIEKDNYSHAHRRLSTYIFGALIYFNFQTEHILWQCLDKYACYIKMIYIYLFYTSAIFGISGQESFVSDCINWNWFVFQE